MSREGGPGGPQDADRRLIEMIYDGVAFALHVVVNKSFCGLLVGRLSLSTANPVVRKHASTTHMLPQAMEAH